MNCNIAIFVGSFDPFHIGHLHILKKANSFFSKVYIVVANNPTKQSQSSFDKRVSIIKQILIENNLKNQIIINDGLTTDIYDNLKADYIIRGVRNHEDYIYEMDLLKKYKKLNPNIKIIYFYSDEEYINIKSSNIN